MGWGEVGGISFAAELICLCRVLTRSSPAAIACGPPGSIWVLYGPSTVALPSPRAPLLCGRPSMVWPAPALFVPLMYCCALRR